MKKLIKLLKDSKNTRLILLTLAELSPLFLTYMLFSSIPFKITINFMWISFYSTLFSCIVIHNKLTKLFIIIETLSFFVLLIFIFIPDNAKIIPHIVLKTFLPFIPYSLI